jgi:isoleucyl-tRNA synthetase
MVVDENRKKFSKSLGNFVNPEMQIEQFGADTIRLFILGSNFMKTEPVPMDKDGRVFAEPVKNILTPLWNAYHFFTLYANAGNIEAKNHPNWFDAPNIMDRYVLTELNELFGAANKSLDDYQPDALVRHTANFLDVLNNWYIRLNRERFWNEDKDAFDTLWTVLACLCRVIAPLAPFISEFIFKKITGEESVHLQKYPDHAKNKESLELLNDMRKVQQIVSVGKQIREKRALRNRLPLASLEIAGWDNSEFDGVIKNELNVKKIIHSPDISKVADGYVYLLTPKIGARLGSVLKEIIPAVKKDKMAAVEKYKLLPDEYEKRLLVKDGLNGAALPDNTAVVILDANPTKELIEEGLANDALRFIQDTRKAVGLDVSDRIVMEYEADGDLSAAMEKHRDRIMSDALITKMTTGAGEHAAEIENHKLSVKITKA